MASIPPISNLAQASNNHILTALSNLKSRYNTSNTWIDPNNRYIVNTVDKIKTDFAANTINDQELIDYISSSIFLHCFNGWSYLSASINSLIEGDYANAIHNAYYAELRAIMSFLASQGIGVFNGQNVIVNSHGQAIKAVPSQQTHIFAKNVFDQWLSSPSNLNTLLNQLRINSSSLKDWFNAFGWSPGSSVPGNVAKDWLNTWSVDMAIIQEEKNFRNFVSYNPQCFDQTISRFSDDITLRLEFINELWKLCAPNNLFSDSILRSALEILSPNIFSKPLSSLDPATEWAPIFTRLGLGPQDLKRNHYSSFFSRKTESLDNLVFDYAKNKRFSIPVTESDTDPVGIISRAALLLLFNTMINESILRQTGTSKTHLKFWLDSIGLKFGYWDSLSEPYIYSDLWEDIWFDIDEIKIWLKDTQIAHSPYNFKKTPKIYSHNIQHFNKTFLWSVGL
ncbi:hypothetical protein [Chitinophaga sp. RAB17]|uniref:hypothetical protein n=1 Tax=Chitinophaga sp. RAB17 TaxID=3233049 RepID=UPI003F91C1A3